MSKINFHFSLLEARFPDLYQEAQSKINGGVNRKDVIADWLNELVCLRGISTEKSQRITTVETDVDLAKNIMGSLLD